MKDSGTFLRSLGRRRSFRKGELFFREGEPVRVFHYLEAGAVRVFRMDERGREVEVVRLGPGDFLGEAVALAGARAPASAEAVRDGAAVTLEASAVLDAAGRDPAAARFLIGLLARKCLALNERIEALGLTTVRQRLARFLLSRPAGESGRFFDLGVRKADLARLLGTVPETLSRTLRRLAADGLIEVRGPRVRIADAPGLRAAVRLD